MKQQNKKERMQRSDRNERGIAYAVPFLVVAVPLITTVCLCIAQWSLYSSALIKVRLLSKQVALYAANSADVDVEQRAFTLASILLKQSNLNCKLQRVQIKTAKVGDDENIEATVDVRVPILSTFTAPPPFMMLTEKTSVPIPVNKICGCIALCPRSPDSVDISQNTTAPALYIPIIRPRSELPVWGAPFDSNLNSLRLTEGTSQSTPFCKFNLMHSDKQTIY